MKPFIALRLALIVAAVLGMQAASAAPPSAVPDAPAIKADARCPVCGMYPARYPRWAAQIVFSDGAVSAFESPGDLFRFLADMGKYDVRHGAGDAAMIYVTDFGAGGWLDARKAFFVSGSKTPGPMNGPDLPAFGTREAALHYAAHYGGKVLGFAEVTPQALRGTAVPQHAGHGH